MVEGSVVASRRFVERNQGAAEAFRLVEGTQMVSEACHSVRQKATERRIGAGSPVGEVRRIAKGHQIVKRHQPVMKRQTVSSWSLIADAMMVE